MTRSLDETAYQDMTKSLPTKARMKKEHVLCAFHQFAQKTTDELYER